MRFELKNHLTEPEIEQGLKVVIKDGLANQAMITLSGGVFLVAFALQLGASNLLIGILAAIPALAQLLQIPAIFIVEKVGNRRKVSFHVTLVSRLFLLVIALIPFLFSGKIALAVLVLALSLNTSIGAVSLCSWNSWMRDLIPQDRLGTFFSRRMSLSMGLGVILSLAAAAYIDYWSSILPDHGIYAYSLLFAMAWIFGLMDTYFITRIPEPKMLTRPNNHKFLSHLLEPLKDLNFKRLMTFLGSWNFAVNLAAPFFTVYMLKRLNLDISYVIGLTVLSQIMNVVFLRIWGRYSDRFSNKSVLGISGPLFMVSILAWTFTTMPSTHFLTIPLLVVIHIFMGISLAGVTLASANIALKLAPKGEATAYLAASSLVNFLAAGIAPILGGRFADFFSKREFSWTMAWNSPNGNVIFQPLNFQSWDFFFFFAFVIGLYSMHRLALVREEGEVTESILIHEIIGMFRRPIRNFSTAGGLRFLMQHPLTAFRHRSNLRRNPPEMSRTDGGPERRGPTEQD
nr:MFS transporter [candidate division Zixibacteria bacterium]